MKIVVLDADTLGADLDLSPLSSCGDVTVYKTTPPELVSKRIEGADAVLINKVKLNKTNLSENKTLKLICIAVRELLLKCKKRVLKTLLKQLITT